ncbi:protein-L-isoaspartate O-methyltransferase family protein [Pseudooceanicola sp. C21-150M6]|uniref:protein-L-isoaspartate O-methyltransferase family protein n=1 Tax=Pseudooceanicola sp. C21-150M6 TaxID=3434355 RepID=UPI003D7FF5D9
MTDFATRRTMMVDAQIRPADVTKFPIIDAMLSVPRENFVPHDLREAAYLGENVDIGEGRVLLEPRTLAKALDALEPEPEELALVVAAGTGYSAAVMARMVEAVIALEGDEALCKEAQNALTEIGADNAVVETGAPEAGAPDHGPYDIIFIDGAVEQVPEALTDQLKEGGRIAALIVEGKLGTVKIGHKSGGKTHWRFAFNAFAPVLPGFEKAKTFAL